MSWARKVASSTDKLCITDGWEELVLLRPSVSKTLDSYFYSSPASLLYIDRWILFPYTGLHLPLLGPYFHFFTGPNMYMLGSYLLLVGPSPMNGCPLRRQRFQQPLALVIEHVVGAEGGIRHRQTLHYGWLGRVSLWRYCRGVSDTHAHPEVLHAWLENELACLD